jgi:hypothetical protein
MTEKPEWKLRYPPNYDPRKDYPHIKMTDKEVEYIRAYIKGYGLRSMMAVILGIEVASVNNYRKRDEIAQITRDIRQFWKDNNITKKMVLQQKSIMQQEADRKTRRLLKEFEENETQIKQQQEKRKKRPTVPSIAWLSEELMNNYYSLPEQNDIKGSVREAVSDLLENKRVREDLELLYKSLVRKVDAEVTLAVKLFSEKRNALKEITTFHKNFQDILSDEALKFSAMTNRELLAEKNAVIKRIDDFLEQADWSDGKLYEEQEEDDEN